MVSVMKTSLFATILILIAACSNERSVPQRVFNEDYFRKISSNDIKLQDPIPGEWRYYHTEDSQTLAKYIKLNPLKPVDKKSSLYILPIGNFTVDQQKIIELTAEYLEAFFQLPVIIQSAIDDDIIPDSARRTREDGRVQFNSLYILRNILKAKKPDDGYALMAITANDLYPSDDWNFVFGQASYADRVGVSSIYRLGPQSFNKQGFILCLRRIINIASHEIGHMFSISHCIWAKCVMNGANSLYETDESPNRLCTECQRKLYWNIMFDPGKRLNEIDSFLKQNELTADHQLIEKDIHLLK